MSETPKSLARHLLSDRSSLRDYTEGKCPSSRDVERRLFLLERQGHPYQPDHYHRLSKERWVGQLCVPEESSSVDLLLVRGLTSLAEKYLFLDRREEKGREQVLVRVQAQKMNAWQELVAVMPPLVLQVALLHQEYPCCGLVEESELLTLYRDKLLPNLRYTVLPTPRIQQLESFMQETGGFHDLHMHLNGTTETDVAWQTFLTHPDKVYAEFSQAIGRNAFAREQFEEAMGAFQGEGVLRRMLYCARALRSYFFSCCCGSESGAASAKRREGSPETVLHHLLSSVSKSRFGVVGDECFAQSYKHPFARLLPHAFRGEGYALATEGLMHYLLLHRLTEWHDASLASMYHFYLLILGAFHQLIVQQPWQQGFDQFQKITLNDLRVYIEARSYEARFLQLRGNDPGAPQLRYLEGRFAPWEREGENDALVRLIVRGWKKLQQGQPRANPAELCLTAHFIKRPDTSRRGIRHKELRKGLKRRAESLVRIREKSAEFRRYVRGVDAASNELDASPEVFAPIFRYLREHGFRHFTYHAGEEFFHLLGGMRVVYEAIVFCGLKEGDRIGHAVALGLDPKLWYESLDRRQFPMRRREYLDDLLFAHSFIVEHASPTSPLMSVLPQLRVRIEELAEKTYGKIYALRVLQQAWLCREEDPLFDKKSQYQKVLSGKMQLAEDAVAELLWKYHNERGMQSEVILVDPLEIFSLDDLSELQLLLLRDMCHRELVIETLPTSNVRIGRYNTFDAYHLKRWLEWRKSGEAIPSIVLGTDDPGIFATSIYNEYANVYCSLVEAGVSPVEVMELIRSMEQNASIYKFAEL